MNRIAMGGLILAGVSGGFAIVSASMVALAPTMIVSVFEAGVLAATGLAITKEAMAI